MCGPRPCNPRPQYFIPSPIPHISNLWGNSRLGLKSRLSTGPCHLPILPRHRLLPLLERSRLPADTPPASNRDLDAPFPQIVSLSHRGKAKRRPSPPPIDPDDEEEPSLLCQADQIVARLLRDILRRSANLRPNSQRPSKRGSRHLSTSRPSAKLFFDDDGHVVLGCCRSAPINVCVPDPQRSRPFMVLGDPEHPLSPDGSGDDARRG